MKSIRLYLIIATLASITLINFASALHGYRESTREVQSLFDSQLRETARLLARLPRDTSLSADNASPLPVTAYQVWSDSKSLTSKSTNTPESPITPFETGFHESNFSRFRWRTYTYHDTENNRWIMVSNRADIRHTAADSIIIKTILPVVIAIPLAGIVIWLIIGHGLSPLRQLSQELTNKRAQDLSPVNIDVTPRELSQVVHSVNDLLRRQEAHFRHEKQFAEEAAHELRTPISGLKIHLHNLSKEIGSNNVSLDRIRSDIDHMGHVVEQILALHRTTPQQLMTNAEVLDLHALTQDLIARKYPDFQEKAQKISLSGTRCQIRGDRLALESLLLNLLDNARKYSPQGGNITVSVEPTPKSCLLCISDSGAGIPKARHEDVFKRFYRIDEGTPHDTAPGVGLGLSIVKHIADLHGATVALGESRSDTGLSVTVTFSLVEDHD